MIMVNRVIWIILDSVGMGELPDAARFHDEGSNTLGNLAAAVGLSIPNMRKLGLGNIEGMKNILPVEKPKGCYGRLGEISDGKDTTTGHWEMVGIYSKQPFPTYPNGFPEEILEEFKSKAKLKGVLGNCAASGTEIIKQLGTEHRKTGYPIVYTSADSVFQIACHEEIYSPKQLYQMCEIAREILKGEHAVARVIARPFVGEEGKFVRTANRRDFSLKPPMDNLLVRMKEVGLDVIAVGKIEDIFDKVGITEAVHTKDNMDGVQKTIQYMKEESKGLIFTNLVEFDMKWGHRNDVLGYANGLEEFDKVLPDIINAMKEEDILIINADHGCDPTTLSTDHSREYVPLLLYGKELKENIDLKTGKTFANIGQTISEIFKLPTLNIGESFWNVIRK
jgi:phosphopentomutase